MPERTTEDYEGVQSVKVQQAIHAILNDEAAREAIPITTLINFNDSILEENTTVSSTASSSRPKSSKRPKSAKKKKMD